MKTIVVKCEPSKIWPYSLPLLMKYAAKKGIHVHFTTHIHSDIVILDDTHRKNMLNFLPKLHETELEKRQNVSNTF